MTHIYCTVVAKDRVVCIRVCITSDPVDRTQLNAIFFTLYLAVKKKLLGREDRRTYLLDHTPSQQGLPDPSKDHLLERTPEECAMAQHTRHYAKKL